MPELPEVETIKRQLNQKIKGKTIREVEVRLRKFVKYPLEKFKKLVAGAKIVNVSRRAKLLIFELSNGYCLVIHLKLTGQLIFNGQPNKHTHLIYYFTDKSKLIHNDLRQFGFVKVIPKKELAVFLEKEGFGPEPLTKEFTLELFKGLLSRRKKSKIKPLLMDQKFMAGIGNLYADEILFYAGVRPVRLANSLKPAEIKKIYQEIKRVLQLAIKKRGSSAENYLDAQGKKGNFMPLVKVYQRTGQPCDKCGTKIQRIKISSRSAHFCPKCQK
ncbi:MAG: DNA-formamidopyrimidine glycosylase [Patescibacteria group bacterium]